MTADGHVSAYVYELEPDPADPEALSTDDLSAQGDVRS